MQLVLARHGNTFERGEEPVWLGPHDDPALTREGKEQAVRLAKALLNRGIRPSDVYAAPSHRMRDYADIVVRRLGLEKGSIVDERLSDIDYGAWNGLSNGEVVGQCGSRGFRGWYENSVWPSCSCWRTQEKEFRTGVRDFFVDVTRRYGEDQALVAVVSHGFLKCLGEFLKHDIGAQFAHARHRVATGNVCHMLVNAPRLFTVSWNEDPEKAFASRVGLAPDVHRTRKLTTESASLSVPVPDRGP